MPSCSDMASEPLIVTFSDARYLPLLGIWLDKLQRLGLRRIRILVPRARRRCGRVAMAG